ncbi:MAG: hypothetical protein OEY66_02415 [Gammaproteobacteria bacterium]|nr:hypothetical protein [Gammaproteobacteria bacterium]
MFKLSMIAISLWLTLASTSIQASSDTGFLGMGGWRPTVETATVQESPC